MSEVSTVFVDRRAWPTGPWDSEPDRVAWVDIVTGYPCLVRRGGSGAWCGYVGLPSGHPDHGAGSDDPPVDVHGGLTFSRGCEGDPITGICHVAEDGDHVWWLGFDCAHYMDATPLLSGVIGEHGTYRDLAYVRAEVVSLAQQLADRGTP